jgi:hypothetical protein
MLNQKLILTAVAIISACPSSAQLKPAAEQPVFACNLKAFQPGERQRWRKLIDEVMGSVTLARDLPDGYALQLDSARVSVIKVAEWIDLERKCCPFFDFRSICAAQTGACG